MEYAEMVYKPKWERKMLRRGVVVPKVDGEETFEYYIISQGRFPVAYIKVPEKSKYYQKNYDEIDLDVHGGLTYSRNYLAIEDKVLQGWFLGWDYAHVGDYIALPSEIENEDDTHKWTVEEIQEDVYRALRELRNEEL